MKNLLDQIDLPDGPHADLLFRFFLVGDKTARDLGVRLSISTDFDELVEVNRRNASSWPTIISTYNPAHAGVTAANAFWLKGVDAAGRTVLTRAARFFDLEGTFREAGESLRLFYDDPSQAAGETFRLDGPAATAAERITGPIVFQGGAWHHPSTRRQGLSGISVRITRAIGFLRFRPEFWVSLVDDDKPRLTRAYGAEHVEPGVRHLRPDCGQDHTALLLWFDRAGMLADLARSVEGNRYVGAAQRQTQDG